MGQRCSVCGKVYVPSRGSCPTDGVPTTEDVELANTGHHHHLLRGQRALRRPVHRDPLHLRPGAARRGQPLVHGPDPGDPHRPDPDGHAGRGGVGGARRAHAVAGLGRATSGPTASPTPTTRPTRSTCEPGGVRRQARHPPGVGRLVRPGPERAPGRGAQRGRDADAGDRRGVRQHRDHQGRRRLHLLGLDRLPDRRPVQLRDGPRRGGRVAAPGREPRGDGRGLGPVRGLGAPPGRGDRRRPGLRLRPLVARQPQRDPHPAARPLLPGPAVAGRGQPGRPAGPGPHRRRQGQRGRLRRRRRPQPQGRPGQPQRPGGHRRTGRRAARGRLRGGTTPPPRPPAHHRRGGRHRAGRRGQGRVLVAARCGSPASTTGWRPTPSAPAT